MIVFLCLGSQRPEGGVVLGLALLNAYFTLVFDRCFLYVDIFICFIIYFHVGNYYSDDYEYIL